MRLPFRQVDVFTSEPHLGNPVAVVHDADGLTDAQMAAFARWTNLSETTFLLSPTDPAADYRVRIFTPGAELPFAGHPTLGTAHAWLEAGGRPASGDIVQECGVGLVTVRREDGRLAFAAPALLREGSVDEDLLVRTAAALGIAREGILEATWCDNGPGWIGVRLADAASVLALTPSYADLPGKIGVVGAHPAGSDTAIEVRAFLPPEMGIAEDPVTGSLNAALGQWVAGDFLPNTYVASQGTALGRRGRVHVRREGSDVWVGGDTTTILEGTARF